MNYVTITNQEWDHLKKRREQLEAQITEANKIIAEVCRQCGEKDLLDGCQNDCWYHDLEVVLNSSNNTNGEKTHE